jgi:hypothetical protein
MTLREAELARYRRAQHKSQKQNNRKKKKRSPLEAPLPFLALNEQSRLHDQQVLSFRQWCALNGFSERTGRRLLKSGQGPIITGLSEKRIGVTVGNNRRWQESRARGAA